MSFAWASAILLAGLPFQDVDEKKVDQAIAKGVEYLRTAPLPIGRGGGPDQSSGPLVLLTLIHARASEKDALFQSLL